MIDTGSTGFMMICSSYVFFMTPGLAFFYGGLCRRKNVVNTMMSSIFIMGLASVLWVAIGYSLSFGGNVGGIIGTFQNAFLNGVGWEPGAYSDQIPGLVFVAFQMMFAIITPALLTGSVVGRMNFKALFLLFICSLIIYIYFNLYIKYALYAIGVHHNTNYEKM